MGGMGMPAEKARDAGATARRLLARLRPERMLIGLVVGSAVVAQAFAVAGPKLLGNATNILFAGVVGKQLPAGVPKDQVVERLRAAGDTTQADMLSAMDVVPGVGVDFGALRGALLVVVAAYVLASLFMWVQQYVMAGVTQRTIFGLREEVDLKLGRLPLRYFDSHPRGDILSRVTNDIDNVSQTLQQTLTQLITSLFSVLGVLVMMVWISPLLAVISLVSVPLSIVVTMLVAKRSQPQFALQWKWTGTLNGHVEETYSGHDLVKVYGRSEASLETFDAANDEMYKASFKAQFVSGIIMPAMNIIGNLSYVGIAVLGGLRVASGAMSLGDVQAFIQYSRQFTMPITQLASITNVVQSGLASAERVFELLDEPRRSRTTRTPVGPARAERARRVRPDLLPLRGRQAAHRGPLARGAARPDGRDRRPDRRREDDARQPAHAVLRARRRPDHPGRRRRPRLTRDDLRRSFGMVLQDAWLFGGTIHDNIAYGATDATAEQVLEAARAAHVDHFVRTLPNGYDTVLDDDASNVSARGAAAADDRPGVPRRPVDPHPRRGDELGRHPHRGAHPGGDEPAAARPHELRHRAPALDDPRRRHDPGAGVRPVVEQGDHETLLAHGGVYADLYRSQFARGGAAAEDDEAAAGGSDGEDGDLSHAASNAPGVR